jgi:thioesterase domain-containing protein
VPTLLFTARDERSDRFQRLLPLASAPEWRDALPDLEICNVAADHFSIVSSDVLRTISGRITDFLEVS